MKDKIVIGSMIVLALICLACAGIGASAEGVIVKLLMWGLGFVCLILLATLHKVGGTTDSKESFKNTKSREKQNAPTIATETYEYIEVHAGYWKFNVYLNGELVHSLDDRYGDIYAELKSYSTIGEFNIDDSNFLNFLIDKIQTILMTSGKRKLTNDEVKVLKIKMVDIDNMPTDDD